MESKLKDKLLKLYELAKRGVDGEKVNAQFMLDRLLKRHGFTTKDIEDNVTKRRYYRYTTVSSRRIISQILYRIIPKADVYYLSKSKKVWSIVTDYEHVQILELIDFHLENFKNERKQLLLDLQSAYIQKHQLFSVEDDENQEERNPLSVKEKQDLWRIFNTMESMSDNTYIKKLE